MNQPTETTSTKVKTSRPPPRPTAKGKNRSQADSVWKEVLEDFFELFMLFFFPNYHQLIDWTKGYKGLDKEMIEITEESGFARQSADKLFRVALKSGKEELILLHIEVQGYKDDHFDERVYTYKSLIWLRYRQKILSFAILTDPDKNFRPTGYRWQLYYHRG